MDLSITTIDEYVMGFPEEAQIRLETIRGLVHDAVPEAEEAIKYGIPTFVFFGNLLHFGAYKKHIGFYPGPAVLVAFDKKLEAYKRSKGTVQFVHDEPLPTALISEMIGYCVKLRLEKVR